jgi:hypothetical protein
MPADQDQPDEPDSAVPPERPADAPDWVRELADKIALTGLYLGEDDQVNAAAARSARPPA